MRIFFLIYIISFSQVSHSQLVSIERPKKGNESFLVIKIQDDTVSKVYWPSCLFRDVTELSDSIKIRLIGQLLSHIDKDTSLVYKNVEPLSYRYKGRFNKLPISTRYNIQIAALIMINYIALSQNAVEYSPYPVLFDNKIGAEFSRAGNNLNTVIKKYKKWFKLIHKSGFKNYKLPLASSRYEWYGTLFREQRTLQQMPKWSKYYDCPLLIREED